VIEPLVFHPFSERWWQGGPPSLRSVGLAVLVGQCRLPVWYLHDPEFRLSTHSTEQRAMVN